MMKAFAGVLPVRWLGSPRLTQNQNHESRTEKAKESTVSPHRFKSSLHRAWIVAAFLLAGGPSFAQQDSGGILVTVKDASGAAVAKRLRHRGKQRHPGALPRARRTRSGCGTRLLCPRVTIA